jgi:hypothetical protein
MIVAVRDLLKNFLPQRYGVSQGFVVSPNGDISKQCDIIVYAPEYTPVIRNPEQQRFFPIESVVAVGEVKSSVDSRTLRKALTNLVWAKEIRAKLISPAIVYQRPNLDHYNPTGFERDQIGTFLFAESISCKKRTIARLVREVVKGKHTSFKVNLIASVNDFCTTYRDHADKAWYYPTYGEHKDYPLQFRRSDEDNRAHLKLFLNYLLMIIDRTTIMDPSLTEYFGYHREISSIVEPEL